MNNYNAIGRLTADLESKATTNGEESKFHQYEDEWVLLEKCGQKFRVSARNCQNKSECSYFLEKMVEAGGVEPPQISSGTFASFRISFQFSGLIRIP